MVIFSMSLLQFVQKNKFLVSVIVHSVKNVKHFSLQVTILTFIE